MAPETAYDLEFRAIEDDAWYSVAAELSEDGETLKLAAQGFDHWKPRFRARDFKSAAEVDEFAARFRTFSPQVQDDECRRVKVGVTVCASLSYRSDDLRYYDAVVEGVQREDHSVKDGEEECLCTFLLCWQQGPMAGSITLANIAGICVIQTTAVANSKLTSFIKLTKERTLAAKPKSSHALGFEECLGQQFLSETRLRDSEFDSNSCNKREDRSGNVYTGGSDPGNSSPCYFFLIDNLEKNLSTSTMRHFILEHTLISSRAYLLPTRSSVPCGSAAIATDSKENIEKIYGFLVSPEHFIVSSRGRPWVVYEKVFHESSGATEILPQSQDEFVFQRKQELQVVHSGTEAYSTVKELRNMFVEFLHHEERLYQTLASKETKILKSFHSGETMRKTSYALRFEEYTGQQIISERRLQDSNFDSNSCNRRKDRGGIEDTGGSHLGNSGPCYFVLIGNLEKNLLTSTMRQFILEHTHVSSRAYLLPSRSSVPCGSAAIATDSKENIEKIYGFLLSPEHFIVSSRGRPWVVCEKVLNESCGATESLPQSQDEFVSRSKQELQVVHSGTEACCTAKNLRDLFVEFLRHEERLYRTLALKETQILKSFHSGEITR